MKHLKKSTFAISLIILLVIIGAFWYAKEGAVSNKVMMYYGGFEIEEMFDASRWFSSDMYKSRYMEADKGSSKVTMLRVKPTPLTPKQLEDLPFVVAGAFDHGPYEDVNTEALILDPPDLSKRIRYVYSAFSEPNKPVDYYDVFLDLNGQRYVVTFARDAQSGDALPGGFAEKVPDGLETHAEYRKIFAEIEDSERKSR